MYKATVYMKYVDRIRYLHNEVFHWNSKSLQYYVKCVKYYKNTVYVIHFNLQSFSC